MDGFSRQLLEGLAKPWFVFRPAFNLSKGRQQTTAEIKAAVFAEREMVRQPLRALPRLHEFHGWIDRPLSN